LRWRPAFSVAAAWSDTEPERGVGDTGVTSPLGRWGDGEGCCVLIDCIVRDADLTDDNGDGDSEVARGREVVEGGREFKSGAIVV
jgi:hypothetical protein